MRSFRGKQINSGRLRHGRYGVAVMAPMPAGAFMCRSGRRHEHRCASLFGVLGQGCSRISGEVCAGWLSRFAGAPDACGMCVALVLFVMGGIAAAPVGAATEASIVTLPCPYAIADMQLHTLGNKLLNQQNKIVVLHGVDLPSLEWMNRGDHIRRSMRVAIMQWHCQIIRIPTSVNRWFGQAPGQSHGGRIYRHIVDQLVRIAARHHVYVVLDLHWNDMNRTVADIGQHRMPDHTCARYWRSAARRYMDYPNVFYDLYNEPHGISWITWRDGGICTGETKATVVTYRAVGMQRLYDVVRHTGADNIVIIGGISWAYDEFGVTHGYAIAGKNIVYDCHVYPWKSHWKHNFESAAKRVPLIFDEFGGTGKQLTFGRKVIAFAAAHHICWCSWSFHTQAGPVLIKNWHYQPSKFGALIKSALQSSDATGHKAATADGTGKQSDG